jgi:hypothetical protein
MMAPHFVYMAYHINEKVGKRKTKIETRLMGTVLLYPVFYIYNNIKAPAASQL